MRIRQSACLTVLVVAAAAIPAQAAVVISTAATQNMSCSAGVCTPKAADAVLNVGDLEAMLASGNVKVTTTGQGVQAKDIRTEADLAWSATTLSLDAYKSVVVTTPVGIVGGGLSITTNDGGSGGAFACVQKGKVKFATLTSTLIINGVNYTLIESVAALARAIEANPAGNFALAKNYNAGRDGTYPAPPVPTVFSGSFNGLGNAISGLNIDDPTENVSVGLFAQTAYASNISNLRIVGEAILAGSGTSFDSTQEFVGGLVGYGNGGTIANVSVSGSITAGDYALVGGLAGLNFNPLEGCNSTVAVAIGHNGDAGGLVGASDASITDSHAWGSVSGEGSIGGLAGYNADVPIERSSAAVVITGIDTYSWAGGLVGVDDGVISRSSASGDVTCPDTCGGLIGDSNCIARVEIISESYATGNVLGGYYAGGLVGENDDCEVANSYATGSVAGTLAGGLIGENYYSSGVGISCSYSAGSVAGQQYAGGLIAYDNYEGSLKRTYWDTTSSGITNQAQGAGNINNDPGIKGLDNERFTARLPRGFRSRIWAEAPSINAGLPYLVANPAPH